MTSRMPTQQQLFTCLCCQVAFYSAETQRDHYRTDWHRYNLKRKMTDLPPLTAEGFTERVLLQQKKQQQEHLNAGMVAQCLICNKQYASENAYINHLASKKHKENAMKQSTDAAVNTPVMKQKRELTKKQNSFAPNEDRMEEMIQQAIKEAHRLTLVDCIFCPEKSDNFESNITHMAQKHSFFIPDIEFLSNPQGLFQYLADKVSVGHICLSCNGRGKQLHSLEAARKHMIDKGHCKIHYEDDADLEFAEFYDFESINAANGIDEDEWEDLKDDIDEVPEVLDLAPVGRPLMPESFATEDNTELMLPSGKTVGHRAYNKYWKQTLSVSESRPAFLINKMMGQYKILGWNAKSLVEIRARQTQAKEQMRKFSDEKTRVGMKANMQKHFRLQNPI